MAIFYNQATLSYRDRTVNSNVTVGEILDAVAITKDAVSVCYGAGCTVTYVITLTNGSGTVLDGLRITDDLAAFEIGGVTVTPLEYVDGTLRYYVNGTPAATPTVSAGPPLIIDGITLPIGANAVIVYETRVGSTAPLEAGATLRNTAVLSGNRVGADVQDFAIVDVCAAPMLSITKTLEPDIIGGDGIANYTFIIQNTGNTAAVATDDVTVSDVFDPPLTGITVTYNGATLAEGVGYEYNELTGVFTTLAGQITVPAATFATDPVTGVVTVTPGVSVLTVSGNIL